MSHYLVLFFQVDIETPEELKEKFSEMCPIFKNAVITEKDIGEFSREELKRKTKFIRIQNH